MEYVIYENRFGQMFACFTSRGVPVWTLKTKDAKTYSSIEASEDDDAQLQEEGWREPIELEIRDKSEIVE